MISIIIPVYNAGAYLRRCVDSVLAQTYTDWELILVDDGSKDASPSICDEYAARDSRIRVIHKENGGASSARNAGLDLVKGEYVHFVDADDEITPNALAVYLLVEADVVVGGHTQIKGAEKSAYLYKTELVKDESMGSCISDHLNDLQFQGPVCKLYKSALLKGLRFDSKIRLGEDIVFVHSYLLRCRSIALVEGSLYTYYLPDNISGKYSMNAQEFEYTYNSILNTYERLRDKFGCENEKFIDSLTLLMFRCFMEYLYASWPSYSGYVSFKHTTRKLPIFFNRDFPGLSHKALRHRQYLVAYIIKMLRIRKEKNVKK